MTESSHNSHVPLRADADNLLSADELAAVTKQREGTAADIQQVRGALESGLLPLSHLEQAMLPQATQESDTRRVARASARTDHSEASERGRGDVDQRFVQGNELPPAHELASRVARTDLSAEQVVEQCLSRISMLDATLNSFVTVDADGGRRTARQIDDAVRRGLSVGPLAGVPVAIKDTIPTAGLRTTGNSRLFEDLVPSEDGDVVASLREVGAVIIGKNNLNELGWSIPSEDDLTPPPRNPWNVAYKAVGSSSGSAASVAAGLCSVAIGTDGGGSVRLPAGQMGLVGLKPTRGAVPLSSITGQGGVTMGHIGILARHTSEVRAVWEALEGSTPSLMTRAGEPYASTLGVPEDVWDIDMEPQVRAAFDLAIATLRESGVDVEPLPGVSLDLVRAAAFIVLKSEKSPQAEQLIRERSRRIGRSVKIYAAGALGLPAVDYHRAMRVGRWFRQGVDRHLMEVEGLLLPTSPVVTAEAARGTGHARGRNAVFTAPFNLSGHPAVSIPADICSETNLPIGVQLVGRYKGEARLLSMAEGLAPLSPWRKRS